MFMHIDFDAFFASVEQVRNPALAGRPVIVGGLVTDRSVVASASYEARAFGVKTAMPLLAARRLCPQAAFLRGSFKHYARASEQAFAIFDRYTPQVEPASLDEGYLDFASCDRFYAWEQRQPVEAVDWIGLAEGIKREVAEQTGLTVSIGIGSNKLIAKLATNRAKPNGIARIEPGREERFVAPLPVSAIPGIGSKTAKRLHQFNIKTVGQLARIPLALLTATFGVHGEALYHHARGIDASPIRPPRLPKSIGRATTFEADTADRELIEGMLYYLLERAARQMRSLRLAARSVAVQIRYANFETVVKSQRLDQPIDQDAILYRTVLERLGKAYTRRMRLRLVGVTLSGFSPAGHYQESLFEKRTHQTRRGLSESIDAVRTKYGFGSLVAGRAIALMKDHPRNADGFQLRTPSLNR